MRRDNIFSVLSPSQEGRDRLSGSPDTAIGILDMVQAAAIRMVLQGIRVATSSPTLDLLG